MNIVINTLFEQLLEGRKLPPQMAPSETFNNKAEKFREFLSSPRGDVVAGLPVGGFGSNVLDPHDRWQHGFTGTGGSNLGELATFAAGSIQSVYKKQDPNSFQYLKKGSRVINRNKRYKAHLGNLGSDSGEVFKHFIGTVHNHNLLLNKCQSCGTEYKTRKKCSSCGTDTVHGDLAKSLRPGENHKDAVLRTWKHVYRRAKKAGFFTKDGEFGHNAHYVTKEKGIDW